MVITQYKSDFSNNLDKSFYWFRKILFAKLCERTCEYLSKDYKLKLVGICEKDNSILFNGEDFFVTRIKVDKVNEIFFRISLPFIEHILEDSLGKRSEPFSAENMTELEAKILTGLNDYIYKGISPFLAKCTNFDEIENPNLAHLTFITENEYGEVGKIIISVPIAILPPVKPLAPHINFDMGSFPKYTVPVKIISGKSELTLYDIQHIESGDIVVLEESNIKMMTIDLDGQRMDFAINPETSIITGIDDNGGKPMEDNTTNSGENMWDVIPVEISAEFEKVSITLGELKQISEGVIVDVGAIYENKIFLKVENKPIASGELIIINDKYAVRVDEVFTDKPAEQPQAQQSAPQAAPAPAAAPQAAPQTAAPQQPASGNDEDFNYDNFDIEDEDI